MHLRSGKILMDKNEDDSDISWTKDMKDLYEWKSSQDNSFLILCRESTLHGIQYIGDLQSHFCERLFWGIVLIAFAVVAFFSISNILDAFDTNPILVSYQPEEITLDEIPFPAITICNNNLIRGSAMGVIQEQLNKPVIFSREEADLIMQFASHCCRIYPKSLSTRFNYSVPKLSEKNLFDKDFYGKDLSINVSAAARKAVTKAMQTWYTCNATVPHYSYTYEGIAPENLSFVHDSFREFFHIIYNNINEIHYSDEMILRCFWRNKIIKCSRLFIMVKTDAGYCCHFNGIPEAGLRYYEEKNMTNKLVERWKSWKIEDNFNAGNNDKSDSLPPFKGKKAGRDGALSILVNPELDEYYCPIQDSTGFTLLAGNPIDHPEMSGFGIGIGPNSENFVDVSPELTMADSNINDLPISKRLCYFHREFPLKFFTHYTIRNCRSECISNLTLKRCGCVREYMAKNSNTKLCGVINNTCAHKLQREIRTEGFGTQCKQCYPSCTSINYSVGLSKLPMNPHKNPWKVNKSFVDPWIEKNLSIIHVYFGSETIYSKYRQRVYDFSSLLSNAGGLLGLYFGFSVMSALEIFYHLMFKPLFAQSEEGKYIFPQKLKALKEKIRGKFSSETNDHQTEDVIQKIFVKSKMNGNSSYPQWVLGDINI